MDLRFKNMLIIGGYDGFVSIGKRANRTQNTLAIKNKILRIFKNKFQVLFGVSGDLHWS